MAIFLVPSFFSLRIPVVSQYFRFEQSEMWLIATNRCFHILESVKVHSIDDRLSILKREATVGGSMLQAFPSINPKTKLRNKVLDIPYLIIE